MIDFSGVAAHTGRLFFIPSSKCYNAGEEFIENVLEVLLESIEKRFDNYQPVREVYLRYCNTTEEESITSRQETTKSMTSSMLIKSTQKITNILKSTNKAKKQLS